MHTESLPPSDRSEKAEPSDLAPGRQLCGDALRAAIKATGTSNAVIANGIGMSAATISQWNNGKYPGDNSGLEASLRHWLRDRRVGAESGVTTIETEISQSICRRLEQVRQAGELGIVTGPAGIGKSRGQSLYLIEHPLTIHFRCRPWHSGMNGIADDLRQAAGITRLTKGQKLWETIIDHTKGGDRFLVVDDAHELTQRGLQCCVDWHEQTGNPVMFFGLPTLKKKLLKDARRARRVGDYFELALKNTAPLVEHMVDELVPHVNGERGALLALCGQVAQNEGHFGALEKQLKKAVRMRRTKADVTWLAAFRAAHTNLLRSYSLS